MTKDELIEKLNKLPFGTEVYIRRGDDAWTPEVRAFEYGDKTTAYIGIAMNANHANYPEGYNGVEEVDLKEDL